MPSQQFAGGDFNYSLIVLVNHVYVRCVMLLVIKIVHADD